MNSNLLPVIESIYAGVGSGLTLWESSLQKITDLVDGDATAYVVMSSDKPEWLRYSQIGFSQEFVNHYLHGGMIQDPRFQYRKNLVKGQAFLDYEYIPDMDVFEQSELIKYQRAASGVYRNLAANVSSHGLWDDIISISRASHKGSFDIVHKRTLHSCLPHLSRAAELNQTLGQLENQYNAVLGALDHLLLGLVILDKRSKVILKNDAAACIIDKSPLLNISPTGKLWVRDELKNGRLQSAIERCSKTAMGKGDDAGVSMTIETRGLSLLIELMPIRDDNFPDRDNVCGTAIFIVDLDVAPHVSMASLAKIYRLTESECEIAHAVVNGMKVADVAEERRRQIDTVRKQLKSVFNKTGVNSQLELLRLASLASPPIAPKK